jgi:deoxyribonuclease V
VLSPRERSQPAFVVVKYRRLHSWDLTPKEAIALQCEPAAQVDAHTPLNRCELIAGTDVSFNRLSDIFYAGVVVVRLADGSVVERQGAVRQVKFPYVPGILSFREAPVLLDAFAKVESEPDVVMLDAHGAAHPRRFGPTSHVGILLDRPTIGCAKTPLLVGSFVEPGPAVGGRSPLVDRDEVIGSVVRTKIKVKPVFVPVGHRIDLESAVGVTLKACRGYRLPEPTRLAHHYVNELRRAGGGLTTPETGG